MPWWLNSAGIPAAHLTEAAAIAGPHSAQVLTCSDCSLFAGCAGTGKSLLLRHILRALPRDSTFVTGTTGLAGCALGGITINSFAGEAAGMVACLCLSVACLHSCMLMLVSCLSWTAVVWQ